MLKIEHEGKEIEVYTPEEVTERVTAEVATATKKVTDEFTPKITALEGKITEVTTALNERTGEFKQFRKLNDEQVAKLGIAERTIYENGLALEAERQKNSEAEKTRLEGVRDSAIRAKSGTDEKLFGKMKDMWSIIGIEVTTPEQAESKVKMILGAISTTEPDLVASVAGFQGGSFMPPTTVKKDGESFADTDKGRAGMDELGLKIPEAKK